MSVLADLRAAHSSERRRIVVTGADLYASPVTMGQIDKARRKHSDMTSGGFMAEIIIACCEVEDGSPAFTLEDKAGLLRMPVDVVTSIFQQVFASPTPEEHEKN